MNMYIHIYLALSHTKKIKKKKNTSHLLGIKYCVNKYNIDDSSIMTFENDFLVYMINSLNNLIVIQYFISAPSENKWFE